MSTFSYLFYFFYLSSNPILNPFGYVPSVQSHRVVILLVCSLLVSTLLVTRSISAYRLPARLPARRQRQSCIIYQRAGLIFLMPKLEVPTSLFSLGRAFVGLERCLFSNRFGLLPMISRHYFTSSQPVIQLLLTEQNSMHQNSCPHSSIRVKLNVAQLVSRCCEQFDRLLAFSNAHPPLFRLMAF